MGRIAPILEQNLPSMVPFVIKQSVLGFLQHIFLERQWSHTVMTPSGQLLPRIRTGTIYVAKDWQTLPQLWPQVADELAFLVIISTAKIFFFFLKQKQEGLFSTFLLGMSRLNCFKTQWAQRCLCVVSSEKRDGDQNEPDGRRRKLWLVWMCPKQRIWCYFRRMQRNHC